MLDWWPSHACSFRSDLPARVQYVRRRNAPPAPAMIDYGLLRTMVLPSTRMLYFPRVMNEHDCSLTSPVKIASGLFEYVAGVCPPARGATCRCRL